MAEKHRDPYRPGYGPLGIQSPKIITNMQKNTPFKKMTIKEKEAICKVLNILVWKLPVTEDMRYSINLQHFIIAELSDKDIIVYWDLDKEKFIP